MMRRGVLRNCMVITAFALGGVALNIAIAWGIAAHVRVGTSVFARVYGEEYPIRFPAPWGRPEYVGRTGGLGWSEYGASQSAALDDGSGCRLLVEINRYGLPVRSLRASERTAWADGVAGQPSVFSERSIRAPWVAELLHAPRDTKFPAVIEPAAFVFCCVFWSLVLATPMLVTRVLRWRRWRREERCPDCGYDTVALAVCPECGRAVPPPTPSPTAAP